MPIGFFKFYFYFMRLSVLPVCMSVNYVCAWCLWESKEERVLDSLPSHRLVPVTKCHSHCHTCFFPPVEMWVCQLRTCVLCPIAEKLPLRSGPGSL